MYHIALTPNESPLDALSAEAPTLMGAVAELLRAYVAIETPEADDCWFVAAVLEAAQEAIEAMDNCQPAIGSWSDMGMEDAAFRIDIFCQDDARFIKRDGAFFLAPHGAIGLGLGMFNAQSWLYSEDDVADWDSVIRPIYAVKS